MVIHYKICYFIEFVLGSNDHCRRKCSQHCTSAVVIAVVVTVVLTDGVVVKAFAV